jgi:rod shape-determining protein MreC
VYRKTVRRRRAILAVLVAASLVLLTMYFGESANGGLHSVQRGVLEVLAPVQEGANKALKPFRDLFGWIDDTLKAKKDVKRLERERNDLRAEAIGAEEAIRENEQLRGLLHMDRRPELASYQPVTARVIGRSPTVWYETINVDKGTGDGVRVDQPVIDGDGLVGKVTAVTGDASQVTLITDHSSGVSATVLSSNPQDSANGLTGVVQAAVGSPYDLLLDFVSRKANVKPGERVITSGSRSSRLESLFPPGIPIGVVTKVDNAELTLYERVHVRPFADLRRLDFVQVLTHGNGGPSPQERAQLP